MNMAEAVIIASVINLIGFMFILHIRDNQWFKREAFKNNAKNTNAVNKLKIKKIEKDMGITGSGAAGELKADTGLIQYLPQLIGLAKDNPELLDMLGGIMENKEEGGIVDTIGGLLEDNPEILKGIAQGLGKVRGEDSEPINR